MSASEKPDLAAAAQAAVPQPPFSESSDHAGTSECHTDIPQQKRTQLVLESAVAIFSSQGFAATDVQEIADRAGVGKGTVYRRFGNKESLFLAAVAYAKQWMVHDVNRAADAACEPLEQLRRGIAAFIAFFDSHPEVVELLIQERAHFRGRQTPTFFDPTQKENDKWIALFERLVQDGVMRNLPVSYIQESISRFVFGTMFLNYFAGRTRPLAQQCEELTNALFYGLLTPAPDSQR